jgi:hypothetical protein
MTWPTYAECSRATTEAQWQEMARRLVSADDVLMQHFMKFHHWREVRDLPNSMARTAPQTDASTSKVDFNEDFAALKRTRRSDVVALTSCVGAQGYDESLMRTAIEVLARVSPRGLAHFRKRVEKAGRTETLTIIEEIRESVKANP